MTEPAIRLTGPVRILIITSLLLALVGIVVWKGNAATPSRSSAVLSTTQTPGGSLTSAHNDAVADFNVARKSGKPIYVLFHSLS